MFNGVWWFLGNLEKWMDFLLLELWLIVLEELMIFLFLLIGWVKEFVFWKFCLMCWFVELGLLLFKDVWFNVFWKFGFWLFNCCFFLIFWKFWIGWGFLESIICCLVFVVCWFFLLVFVCIVFCVLFYLFNVIFVFVLLDNLGCGLVMWELFCFYKMFCCFLFVLVSWLEFFEFCMFCYKFF